MNGTAKKSRTGVAAEDRAEYAAGLRAFADLLESEPSIPAPSGASVDLFVHDEDGKQAARDLLRKLGGGRWEKKPAAGSDNLIFEGWLHGLPVNVWVDREAVCERRVIGVDEITETVPVGEDMRPVETVTRTVERVEWICSPLLADETAAAR